MPKLDAGQVCEVTGYCVKNIVFAEDEFMSTVSCVPTHQVKTAYSYVLRERFFLFLFSSDEFTQVTMRRTFDRDQIGHWVRQVRNFVLTSFQLRSNFVPLIKQIY